MEKGRQLWKSLFYTTFQSGIVEFDWENSISFAISHDNILLVAFNMLFSLTWFSFLHLFACNNLGGCKY